MRPGYLFLACEDGTTIVRMTRGGEAFDAPEYVVNVGVTEKPALPLHVRHYPRNRPRDVIHLFPRSLKGA